MILENKIVKWIVNIPFIWNTAQNILGANQWKASLYPKEIEGGGTFLDFGCSSGNLTELFLRFEYYGIDVDNRSITAAQKKFKEHPNVHFICLDIIAQGFKKDFFDHILFATAGHHLTDEPLEKILAILIDNLNMGGQLHFFDIIRRPGKDRWSTRLLTRIDQGKYIRTEEAYNEMFKPYEHLITKKAVYSPPRAFITQQDMLYFRMVKR